jgi:aryl-alcohol dehydrogenase-like predicted oxidoreductase
VAVLGLGLAALGRPGYLTVGHGADLSSVGEARTAEAMEQRCRQVCDAAWRGGIRWYDAARSYGLAESFLSRWLTAREISPADVTVSSKWGYEYTAGWRVEAHPPEVKDHSLAALRRQWSESRELLERWLCLYQVHSATLDSGVLDDKRVHRCLAELGVPVGVTLSGPRQAEALRRALEVAVDGKPLFSAVQATWNVLEPSAARALGEAKDAGWTVIVKEALANGRLAAAGTFPVAAGERTDVVALAAAMGQPWSDVVLSGAVTVEQLESNLQAAALVTVPGGVDFDRFSGLAETPLEYWSTRSALAWT